MNNNKLKLMQALPLEMKVARTKRVIETWVDYWGVDGTYVSFSGGKDSTVLLHLVRSLYPEIEAVFSDTGLEYPELREFVNKQENVTIVRPKMHFKEVLSNYGYPVISKEQSYYIYQARTTKSEKLRNLRLNGSEKGNFKIADKWKFMLDAPFPIHSKCCDIMKKSPIKSYEKESGKVPIIGTMAEESRMRKQQYLKHGCNAFDLKTPHSTPLGFWTQEDILQYIYENDLEIASVYGKVVKDPNGRYYTEGVNRTGCVFCMYGVHLEDPNNNRFHKLEESHPKLHDYCINKLGMGDVLDYMNIKYSKNQTATDVQEPQEEEKEVQLEFNL